VVHILKRSILLILALGFALGSHLRPVCTFTLGEKTVQSGCSPAAARQAIKAAQAAAEEILPAAAELPHARRQVALCLSRPADKATELSDALLRSCPGVMAAEAVFAGGGRLGCVRSGAALCSALNGYIENTLPTWANSGHLSAEFELQPMYTRAVYEVSHHDMVLLLTGLAPVMYTDGKGRVSPV
jgi:hypothetical protein